jgi:hypothetical protein
VSATLDRTNTSHRKGTAIISSVLNKSGEGIASAVLSKSTLHRRCQKLRRAAAKNIQVEYSVNKSVVHWDGKLVPDTEASGLVERLPVLLTDVSDGSVKLLGAPKLPSGTGKDAANVVANQLMSWEASASVIGMCLIIQQQILVCILVHAHFLSISWRDLFSGWLAVTTFLKFFSQMSSLCALVHQVDQK